MTAQTPALGDHLVISFIAIVLALLLGWAVPRAFHRPTLNREALRQQIEQAERRHEPRRELRKQFVEATRQELV